MIGRVYATTTFLLKALFREKLALFAILLSLLSLLLSLAVSDLNIGEKGRLFRDALTLLNSTSLHLLALLFTFQQLQRESRGIHIVPLSSGLMRWEYILSVEVFMVVSISSIALLFWGVTIPLIGIGLAEKLYLLLLSATLLSLLFYTISLYTGSRVKSLFYSIAIFFIGNSIDELRLYSQLSGSTDFSEILDLLIPRFYLFDGDNLAVATAHFLLYSGVLLTLSIYNFSRKSIRAEE